MGFFYLWRMEKLILIYGEQESRYLRRREEWIFISGEQENDPLFKENGRNLMSEFYRMDLEYRPVCRPILYIFTPDCARDDVQ